MGRASHSNYVVPIKSDGTPAVGAGRGAYTLTAGATYYFPLGGADAGIVSGHVAWTADPIIERGTEYGASSAAERAKLAMIDRVLKEKESVAGS